MVESLILSAVILIVLVAFLMYYSKAHYAVKIAVFPALIAVVIYGYAIYTDNMGAPINSVPKEGFYYVHHQAGEGGEVIYVWVWTADRGQRLHVGPYERETMQALEGARGRAEGGQEYGRFKANGDGFDYEQTDAPMENMEGFTK